jgi:electron transfer flavoprotein alpha subunit
VEASGKIVNSKIYLALGIRRSFQQLGGLKAAYAHR